MALKGLLVEEELSQVRCTQQIVDGFSLYARHFGEFVDFWASSG